MAVVVDGSMAVVAGCDAAVGTESVVVGVDGSIVVEAEGAGRWRGQSAG